MQGQLLSQFQKHFYNKFSRITPQKPISSLEILLGKDPS